MGTMCRRIANLWKRQSIHQDLQRQRETADARPIQWNTQQSLALRFKYLLTTNICCKCKVERMNFILVHEYLQSSCRELSNYDVKRGQICLSNIDANESRVLPLPPTAHNYLIWWHQGLSSSVELHLLDLHRVDLSLLSFSGNCW